MKEQIEDQLGFSITEEQFQESAERAGKKLDRIISRYGDAAGSRREPEYLAELIYEDIFMDIFSKATVFLAENMLNMEKEHLANCQSALFEQPYCNML